MIVAIDGPAGSGKSAVAKRAAAALGFLHLDSGAIYRAFTLRALRGGADLADEEDLARLIDPRAVRLEPRGADTAVFLDGREVTDDIRTPEVTRNVVHLARAAPVRERVTELVRELAEGRDVVTDGRDTTTVIFPHADHKLYIDAAPEERARRRHKDLLSSGRQDLFDAVLHELLERDRTDRERAVGPLRVAEDAVVLDTTSVGLEDVVARVVGIVRGS